MTTRVQEPGGSAPPLGRVAASAFGWSFLNTALSRLGTLAIGIALARLLGPEEFGTFAVATVALVAVLSFNELGVSLAIVRWKSDPLEIAPTVTTISVAMSCVLFAVLYVTAPMVAGALGDPSATGVVRLMAVAVVISGAVATPAALLQRDFRQRRRTIIDQVSTWLGAGLSLALAATGAGAWGLAIGRVIASGAAAVLFVTWSSYPYRFGFDARLARRLLRFGLPLAGASIIVFATGYAEQMVTGSVVGATALGFYVLAFNLASWPVNVFSQPLRNVAPAMFARMQGDVAQMNAAFASVLRLLATVSFPVCVTLAAAADDIVRVVYGEAWAPAASVLRLLALLAAARIVVELSYDFLVVRRRTGSLLTAQSLWLAALVPILVVAAHWHGITGVAAGHLLLATCVMLPVYVHLLRRCGVRVRRVAGALAAPTAAAATLAAAIVLVARATTSPLLVCAFAGLGCAVSVVGLALPQRSHLRQLRSRPVAVPEPQEASS